MMKIVKEWTESMAMLTRRQLGFGLLAMGAVCLLPLSVRSETVKGLEGINPGATQPVLLSQVTDKEFFEQAQKKNQLGDLKGAIADFNQAIKLNPDLAEAYNNRGIVKNDLGEKQGAIADYTQAIKLNPDYAIAYKGRGAVKSDLGDKQGAIADFNQAIKLNPDLAEPYYNRGNAKDDLGDQQGALSDYQTAAKLFQQQGNTEMYQKARDRIQELQK